MFHVFIFSCLKDSKRSSRSRFINSTRKNVVRFSVDAFALQGKVQKVRKCSPPASVLTTSSFKKSALLAVGDLTEEPIRNVSAATPRVSDQLERAVMMNVTLCCWRKVIHNLLLIFSVFSLTPQQLYNDYHFSIEELTLLPL